MTLNSVVSVINNSSTVTRVSGDTWTSILPGAIFDIAGDNVNYVVAAIVPAVSGGTVTTLYLTSLYLGPTNPNAPGTLSIDYTPNKDLPLINTGDIAVAALYDRAMTILDQESLNVLPEHGPTHRPHGEDPTPLTDTVDGGLWPAVSGNPSEVLCADVTTRDISLVIANTYNAVGNPTFEVDQRNVGNSVLLQPTAAGIIDRWRARRIGTQADTAQQINAGTGAAGGIIFPNSTVVVSDSFLRIQVTNSQPALSPGDILQIYQLVEGSRFRELVGGPTSISVLVRTTVTSLLFGIALQDPSQTRSVTVLATIPIPNVWTVLQFPDIPVWPTAGSFVMSPGVTGYILSISLGAGTTFTSAQNGAWASGNFIGAVGQQNFSAQAAGAQFDIAFVQHQPGPVCSYLVDLPYEQNEWSCKRYFQKSYLRGIALGASSAAGPATMYVPSGAHPVVPIRFSRQMANAPTVLGYSPTTGASGNVRNITASADAPISAPVNVGDHGFSGFTLSSAPGVLTEYSFHWSADTGF